MKALNNKAGEKDRAKKKARNDQKTKGKWQTIWGASSLKGDKGQWTPWDCILGHWYPKPTVDWRVATLHRAPRPTSLKLRPILPSQQSQKHHYPIKTQNPIPVIRASWWISATDLPPKKPWAAILFYITKSESDHGVLWSPTAPVAGPANEANVSWKFHPSVVEHIVMTTYSTVLQPPTSSFLTGVRQFYRHWNDQINDNT